MPIPSTAQVTNLLLAWGTGDERAFEQLVPVVHAELRRIARRQMGHERVGHTLQPTALVNEAYLKLIDIRQVQWQDRAHFFAMSSRVMRRVLVDCARARRYQKRGAGAQQVTLDENVWAARGRRPTCSPSMTRSKHWRRSIRGKARLWKCATSGA